MPALSIDRLLKVATPPMAATVAVPDSVPELGLLPMPTVTLAVLVVRLPPASRIRTVTAGVIDEPAWVFDGCWPNASWAAAPAVMLKAELSARVSAPSVARSL